MQNSNSADADKNVSNVITINEAQIWNHLEEMVRRAASVEEALMEMHPAGVLVAPSCCGSCFHQASGRRVCGTN